MEYLYPDYYKKFQCIASKCEDTCCAGWQIAIDERSLKKYKNVKGVFGNRLKNCINWKEQVFEQSYHRCAFLNELNLCDLYLELGEDALCKTCKRYPRHIEEFENLREIMLSLSCPEACRLILGNKNPTKFFRMEKKTQYEEYECFDFLFFTKLEDGREFLFSLITREDLDFSVKMAIALSFAHDFQRRIQNDQLFEVDDLLIKYQKESMPDILQEKFLHFTGDYNEKMVWLHLVIQEYKKLEPLETEWFIRLDKGLEILGDLESASYSQKKKQFLKDYCNMDKELEQVFITLLYTYFLGAVYDYDVLTKVKFIVISVILIRELDFACWLENESTFTFCDQVEIVHKYSKEIEHSDTNLERLGKSLKTLSQFHIYQMLMGIFS